VRPSHFDGERQRICHLVLDPGNRRDFIDVNPFVLKRRGGVSLGGVVALEVKVFLGDVCHLWKLNPDIPAIVSGR